MRQLVTPLRREPNPRLADLLLPASELPQLRLLLRELLAPRARGRTDQWCDSMLRALRAVTGSDKAILILRAGSAPSAHGSGVSREVLSVYLNQFAEQDRSRIAVQQHGLEVWRLDELWPPAEWERSNYYRAFAVPNALYSTVGLTLHLAAPRAEVCLTLHRSRPEPSSETERRQEILSILLEPIRTGLGINLNTMDQCSDLSSLMDVTGQALALFATDGREVTQNPVMRRVLGQDPEREALREHIRNVAKSVVAILEAHGSLGDLGAGGHKADGTRREVATSQAAYRLRGNLVGRNSLGHGTAILVSLDRVAFQVPAPDSIRARFGLTVRELQVASLLMHRLTNAEIARMLSISPHTARHHTENVLAKVGVRSREALRRAVLDCAPG
jgi:DNA-binding CsgD family transcriptional regulator/PAS domain-containing protein